MEGEKNKKIKKKPKTKNKSENTKNCSRTKEWISILAIFRKRIILLKYSHNYYYIFFFSVCVALVCFIFWSMFVLSCCANAKLLTHLNFVYMAHNAFSPFLNGLPFCFAHFFLTLCVFLFFSYYYSYKLM